VTKPTKCLAAQRRLYEYMAIQRTGLNTLTGKSVLEVGCGRGGGLFYLQHAYTPKMMVGVDSNKVNIEFCTSVYGDERNLFFPCCRPTELV